MTKEGFIIELFCWVDDQMGAVKKHPQAKLYPSELVTIGLLFALKGGCFRAFYRWLKRDCLSARACNTCCKGIKTGVNASCLSPPSSP